jgi:predicted anti-sigma-YlaC factor YlaD
MSTCCITDEVLLAQYFEGRCTSEQSAFIQRQLSNCADCRDHFAQLASLLEDMDESKVNDERAPSELSQRAMGLFDTVNETQSLLSVAIKVFSNFIAPMDNTLTPVGALSLRGSTVHTEDLTYHLTVGQFALAVELNSADLGRVDLSVRPLRPVEPGWTIRLVKGDTTKRLSSFDKSGIQVDALGQGVYTVCLEHQQQNEHQFHLRLVPKDD